MNERYDGPMGIFEDAEVISSYTDEQGVEDGFLIPLNCGAVYQNRRVNLITTTCFHDFVETHNLNEDECLAGKNQEFNSFIRGLVLAAADNKKSDEVMGIVPGGKYWLMQNMTGNYTFMLPDDY